ncbi:MAG TPA: glycoside hydrolase family 30 beta sandwich domain-containing protein [Chitinophagaceae bacterium]|nr:glycoside hydrolase family 30 beta sandwich domain-containing protein [Chitinophagaceae bacterium]
MKCLFVAAFTLLLLLSNAHAQPKNAVRQWITTPDKQQLFSLQPAATPFSGKQGSGPVITVDERTRYQPVDGFGFALTGGSAQHIMRMTAKARAALLQELFGTGSGKAGISYLRVSIGASDLDDHVFSYDDLPAGATDTALRHFSLGPDTAALVPLLQQILRISPSIKILASPWSPPVWMKNNNDTRGGRLLEQYYPVYARYFVQYLRAMAAQGIRIDAITIQNEPLHPGNNPSLLLTAPEEAAFIAQHLGPVFAREGIKTKIVLYDHNANRPDYPLFILDDARARPYVDGSGFHLYAGDISALSVVHDAYPNKHLYFTEQMVVDFNDSGRIETSKMRIADPVARIIIGAMRNWSRNVLLWNLAADPQLRPYTDRGGCSVCQGALTIDGDSITRNLAYYTVLHASALVQPGSVRIASNDLPGLPNVAFLSPQGKKILIVANTGNVPQTFTIRYKNSFASISLAAGAAGTYCWP